MSKGKSTTTAAVDPAQMRIYEDLYSKSKNIASQPFVPYVGSRVAGFNPDQLRGFDATRGMFADSMSYDPRGLLSNMGSQPLDIGSFENPYTTQVVDRTLSDLDRARQMRVQSDQDAAIGRGAFGGSRSGILEAETNKNFADAAARTAGNLRRSGFDTAANLAMQDRGFRSGLQSGLLGDQYRNLNLMSGIGGQQQGLQQRGMDAGYGEFMRALNYGPQQLGLLAQGVSAMPQNRTQTSSETPGTLEKIGNVAGTIGTILSISDIRLKENIELVDNVKGYNVYTWDWNDTAKELGVDAPTKGVIAQEILQTKPEAVTLHNSGYLMVNYGEL